MSAGLGMLDAYGNSADHAPKYSQGELEAAVSAQLSAATAAHERATAEAAAAAESKMSALAAALQASRAELELLKKSSSAKAEQVRQKEKQQDALLSHEMHIHRWNHTRQRTGRARRASAAIGC